MTTTTRQNKIGSTSIYPESTTPIPPQEAGTIIGTGAAIEQGKAAIEWYWPVISEAAYQTLLSLCGASATIQYWGTSNVDVTATGWVHRPTVGPHRMGYYSDVRVRVTGLT